MRCGRSPDRATENDGLERPAPSAATSVWLRSPERGRRTHGPNAHVLSNVATNKTPSRPGPQIKNYRPSADRRHDGPIAGTSYCQLFLKETARDHLQTETLHRLDDCC